MPKTNTTKVKKSDSPVKATRVAKPVKTTKVAINKKCYVIDTNVLIYDPNAFFKFEENDVVIPLTVIEEIDKFKPERSERGKAARDISKILDGLRSKGHLTSGIPLNDKGAILTVKACSSIVHLTNPDDQILDIAVKYKEDFGKDYKDVILVTMDTNLRIKADVVGVTAESYYNQEVKNVTLKNDLLEIDIDFDFSEASFYDKGIPFPEGITPKYNQCIMLKRQDGKTYLAREKNGLIKGIKDAKEIFGIKPRNKEQRFALEYLLDPEIKLVILLGSSGTGKSILSTICGLSQTFDGIYSKMSIARSNVLIGEDIGFLPGDLNSKLDPLMKSIYDNIDYVLMTKGKSVKFKSIDELKKSGILEVEAMAYLRGRSIPNQYIAMEEGQNTSPKEVKALITRSGVGTKIVITGDVSQIDSKYLNETNNGLSYCLDRLKNQKLVATVIFEKCERSELSELAANLL
jgi:PhoH-like ATPase